MTLSSAATKFINLVEAMSQWPINTTVVEVAGQVLSLKMARELAKELQTQSQLVITIQSLNSIASIAVQPRPIIQDEWTGLINAHIAPPPISDTAPQTPKTSPIADNAESEKDNEQT